MNTTFRQIAVSGSAAVALLGGAAAITLATPSPASAATQHAAERAVTAPVTLPDGRTLRITGMGGYGHQATGVHVATVAAFKTDATPGTDPGVGTGLTPDGGAGAQLQNPVNGTQTGYNQQVTTQAGGGTIAVGVVSIILLSIIVYVKVKHSGLKAGDAALGVVAGVAVGGTFLGPMISNMTNSLVSSIGNALQGMG